MIRMLKVTIPLAFERPDVKERKGRLLKKKGLTATQKKVWVAFKVDFVYESDNNFRITCIVINSPS